MERCLTDYTAGPENTDMMNSQRIDLGPEWFEAISYMFLRDQTENQRAKYSITILD